MNAEQRLLQWSATFEILSGSLVCRGCLARQGLADAELPFLHYETCKSPHSEPDYPWIALHELLDRFRG
jgi:hypothetical protein